MEGAYSIQPEWIEVDHLDTLVRLTRYSPIHPAQFIDGLILAGELRNQAGTVLYPGGTEISRDRLARLLQLKESSPNSEFHFRIARNKRMLDSFRDDLVERLHQLLKRRREIRLFNDLLSEVEERLGKTFSRLFEDADLLLELYRVRFLCEQSRYKKACFYNDHAMNVALIALGISRSHKYRSIIGEDVGRLIELLKAALFHNFGAITEIDRVLEAAEDERMAVYWDANRKGFRSLAGFKLGEVAGDAIQRVILYHLGRREFIGEDEWPGAMANILVVADLFLQKEAGLFGDPLDVRRVVDQLNVRVMERQLNDRAVQALTLGLNLMDIFDFYSELDQLVRKCPYESAVPYPLTGFHSPTIFVCRKTVTECRYLEMSINSVKLVRKLGELPPGDYSRCKLLCPKLMAFYDQYYKEIKESLSENQAKPAAPAPAKVASGKPVVIGLEEVVAASTGAPAAGQPSIAPAPPKVTPAPAAPAPTAASAPTAAPAAPGAKPAVLRPQKTS